MLMHSLPQSWRKKIVITCGIIATLIQFYPITEIGGERTDCLLEIARNISICINQK